jgi:hypothetical protein
MATFKKESRYRGSTVSQVELDGELESYVFLRKPLLVEPDTEDKYVTLDQGNQFRPDIISNQVYGDPNFGWAIMEVNNIRSFVELTMGLRLRIPPLTSVVEAISESNDV